MEVYHHVNITQSHSAFVCVLIEPAFQVSDSMTDMLLCFHFLYIVLLLFVCVTLPSCKPQKPDEWQYFSRFLTSSFGHPQKMQSLIHISHTKKKKKNERKKQLLYLSPLHSNMLSVQFKLYTTSTSGSLEWLSGCQMSLPVFPQKAITWSGLSTLWNPLHILVSLLNPRELSDSGRVRIGRTDTGLKSKIRLRAGESIR